MTIKIGTVKAGTFNIGTVLKGTVMQAGGVVPPPPTGRIFKNLNGDLFINFNDKLFTSL